MPHQQESDIQDLPGQPRQQDPSVEFAEQSYLTYLIPSKTDLDLEDAFGAVEQGKSVLDSIDQRDSLFFDETVDVLLILKTPWADEKLLRPLLTRLIVSLEVQIVNGELPGRDASPADTIFTGIVPDTSDPFIIVADDDSDNDAKSASEEDETVSQQHVYAVWKLPVLLARPRVRLHNPAVTFSASASIKPEVSAEMTSKNDGYLQSGTPSGLNLLESLGDDPALGGIKPRLSALRVSRVAPVTRQQDFLQRVRALQQLRLSIHPVLHTRIRFSRPNTAPPSSTVVAVLEVDFTSLFDCEILLDDITLSVQDGRVKALNDDAYMQLPLSCVSHDHITFLYHIVPHELDLGSKTSTRDLSISIKAIAQVEPDVCTPRLSMSWTTSVDFAPPVNPGFATAPGTGIQRAHRPSQLSVGGSQNVSPLKSPSVTRPDALPTLEASTSQAESNLPDLGITMSFTGPSEPVRPGDVFSWTVYVVNRSSEKSGRAPRKLALVAVPKRRRNEVRSMRPPSSGGGRRRGEKDIADAIVDENVLHALQKNSQVDSTDVLCLSADTRVGPLAPGACHVVELQFLALQPGIVGLEAIRVVDMGSQEHVDIKDLPTMIVEPAAS